jgi:hypothetical protein
MIVGPVRVPCFLEFDVTVGELESHPEEGYATAPLTAKAARIVTEDGTVIVTLNDDD